MTLTQSGLGEAVTALARVERPLPYDGNKAPEEIEDDIVRTRYHLSATIDALERQLGPRRMIARSAETFLNALEGDAEHLAARPRENALPLLLIVAGAAWLLLTRSQQHYSDATLVSEQTSKCHGKTQRFS